MRKCKSPKENRTLLPEEDNENENSRKGMPYFYDDKAS